jgi:hypothetical protein
MALAYSPRADEGLQEVDGAHDYFVSLNGALGFESSLGVNSSLLTIGSRGGFIASKWHRPHAAHPSGLPAPLASSDAKRPGMIIPEISAKRTIVESAVVESAGSTPHY